jgi:hypothetical protein
VHESGIVVAVEDHAAARRQRHHVDVDVAVKQRVAEAEDLALAEVLLEADREAVLVPDRYVGQELVIVDG